MYQIGIHWDMSLGKLESRLKRRVIFWKEFIKLSNLSTHLHTSAGCYSFFGQVTGVIEGLRDHTIRGTKRFGGRAGNLSWWTWTVAIEFEI